MPDNPKISNLKYLKPIGGFHGVSVVFPTLKDVFDYEEKKIKIIQGYPRFVTHPLVKNLEEKFEKRFKAKGVLCCHSYESAVFLITDYYFRKGTKIYFSKGLPTKIFNLLDRKFKNLAKKSNISHANVVICNIEELKTNLDLKDKVLIGLVKDNSYIPKMSKKKFDILILNNKDNDIGIIIFYNTLHSELNILRRHCGFIVSSRKLVRKENISTKKVDFYSEKLKNNLSGLELANSNQCFLYPSGMAAVFTAILSIISSKKPKIIVLGSLYIDTIRILEKWFKKYDLHEPIFIRKNFLKELKNHIDNDIAGIIFEIPSNPLIQLVNVEKVISLAHLKNAKVIIDNTIATPYNFNPFNYNADIIVHSTTKFLSGKNNHIGGVLLAKNKSDIKNIKKINELVDLNMCIGDMRVLARNLKHFEVRMEKINKNSEIVANYLSEHESIETVYYPTLKSDPNNLLMRKYLKGASGLISFILKNSSFENAEKFYNNLHLPILKGPSLGSEKTLLCPYVILAHFNDIKQQLKKLGLDFYLMRMSVGTEPVETILKSLKHALSFIK